MNKKRIILIVILIIVVLIGLGIFSFFRTPGESSKGVIKTNENGKVLVVYFSAQNHTENVAKKIATNLNADIFEITPEEPYSEEDLEWTNDNSRTAKERDDVSLRDVKLTTTEVENWKNYDVVLIGYPIWFGSAAYPTSSFVKANDFTGKTVIPFCTSTAFPMSKSGIALEETAGTGNWVKGHRFKSDPSDKEIQKWTDSLIQNK